MTRKQQLAGADNQRLACWTGPCYIQGENGSKRQQLHERAPTAPTVLCPNRRQLTESLHRAACVLAGAATDVEPLRASNKQLRADLSAAQARVQQLEEQLQEERAARQAAEAQLQQQQQQVQREASPAE